MTSRKLQLSYMIDVASRFDNVLALVGVRPGALAKLFMYNFVGMAKQAGATRQEAERLLAQTWERFDKREKLEDVEALVRTDIQ